MNFGGFSSNRRRSIDSGDGGKMVADGLCSFNSNSQPFCNSPLYLAVVCTVLSTGSQQPKMENLGEMGLPGESLVSKSGSDQLESASVDDQNARNKASKKEKYRRHKTFQIQELEEYFKKNPHPDEKGRLELGKRLGLESRQVKFWFQNRRTQMKTQLEHHENIILKQENEKLRHDNFSLRDAMRNPICEGCGSPAVVQEVPAEQLHLLIENGRLKDELNRLGVVVMKFLKGAESLMPMPQSGCFSQLDLSIGRNVFSGLNAMDLLYPLGHELGNSDSNAFQSLPPVGPGLDVVSVDKPLLVELAVAAMKELIKLAQLTAPLWLRTLDGTGEFMNPEEYARTIVPCIGIKPSPCTTEATRATSTVFINSLALVEALMDANQWTEMFPRNIGQASFDVICPGMPGNRDGSVLLIQAEFQILSPMVPSRQVKFIRFCKHHGEGMWAVVDVSVDDIFHGLRGNCRRLPSGCIIQDMPNGYSKVMWIEHTEYDETTIHHLYRPLLGSGTALGAQKWLNNLKTQCERLFTGSGEDQPEIPPSGKKGIITLAQKMTRSFISGICGTIHKWELVQDNDDVKLMIRKSIGDNGEPAGVILSAATTVCVPVSSQELLEFLQNEKTRGHWDALSEAGHMQQVLKFSKGQDNSNGICLLRARVAGSNANPSSVQVLQETCTDVAGSVFVNAPIDAAAINAVMNGGDPSGVAILPSGFAIMPGCFSESGEQDGSLLTVGFQILVNNLPAANLTMESVDTVKSLIARRLQGIKSGLGLVSN